MAPKAFEDTLADRAIHLKEQGMDKVAIMKNLEDYTHGHLAQFKGHPNNIAAERRRLTHAFNDNTPADTFLREEIIAMLAGART